MDSASYVYAIVGEDTPLPSAEHVPPASNLTRVPYRNLAAVTGHVVDDRRRLTTEAVLRHEAVVEAVRQQGRALPVRFGTVLRDARAVTRALAERYDELAADLERVGDKVELSLTVLLPAFALNDAAFHDLGAESAGIASGSGAGYLRARAAELERNDVLTDSALALAGALDDTLGRLALERRVALMPKPRIAVRMTYLLDPSAVAAFRAAFDARRPAWAEWRMLLTGPWPPYSFVRQREAVDRGISAAGLAEVAQRFTDRMWGRAG